MSLERIYFITEDDMELCGLLETPEEKVDEVVISVHGMQSNCMKMREHVIGRKVTESKRAYFAFNNRGHELRANLKKSSGGKVEGGTTYEDVLDGYYDIKGAIEKMIELGFKKIHLQGHSLGCTKIVYTYNRLKEEGNKKLLEKITSVILLSLVDIVGTQRELLGEETYNKVLEYAENKEKENKSLELMPEKAFIHPITVKSYLRYYRDNEKINFAKYGDKEYDFKELNNIDVPLFLRWGTVYEMVVQNLDELIIFLKSKIKNEKLDIGYIKDADHGYYGKEELLAEEIILFINQIR